MLSMAFQKIRDHNKNLSPSSVQCNRFKAKEYISGTDLFVAYNSQCELSGRQVGFPCAFKFSNSYTCDEEDVTKFIIEVRERGLFDNYIKSIMEITHVMFTSEYDSYNNIVKKYHK